MESTLIDQGLDLMLYGMGIVFAFLTLLVFMTTLMSNVIQRWFPEKEVLAAPKHPKRKPDNTNNISPLTLKIIQAAINQHRKR